MTCCDCILKATGGITLSLLAIFVSKIIYRIFYPFFIAKTLDLHALAGAKYAVITGSTDGIGKAYASQLAQKGFNIVLISRTQSKLESVKKEIELIAPGTEVEVIAFDFTCADFKEYQDKIFKKLRTLEVGILINNVGDGTTRPEIIHNTEGGIQKSRDVNVINTLPMTILSHEVLKQMVPRNKGIIINVGSLLGDGEMGGWCVYSSTKKYMSHFSGILHNEYAPLGITVQYLITGLVATNLSKVTQTSYFAPSPNNYVRSALATIGHVRETTGYFAHQFSFELFKLLPTFLLDFLLRIQMRKMKEEYLKEIEAKKQK
uniref:Hydroxysteroid 17-beta dehydrogenase 12 n=1 Tax=Rhabditophanes sp. KR3021 TaxID=114890 RepID=A0AC35U1W0_9BILA